MAQTTYNASVAYNAPIRYDGVTADVAVVEPAIGFDPPRRRRDALPAHRWAAVAHSTHSYWVITTETAVPSEDDLILLDLL